LLAIGERDFECVLENFGKGIIMKKTGLILLVLILTMQLSAGKNFEKYRDDIAKRKDLFWGYAAGISSVEAGEAARLELAKQISVWYLTERGLEKRISYSKRDQYEQMMLVWLESMAGDIASMRKEGSEFEEVCSVSRQLVQKNYQAKEAEIELLIWRGEKALEFNKLGLFFRNFYMALVEIDLLAGKKVEVNDKAWSAKSIMAEINHVAENFAIKIVGDTYENGNRRLVLQLLNGRRPMNDLRLSVKAGDVYQLYSISDRYLQVDLFGYEYAEMESYTFGIDLQDKFTHVWGREVEQLSEITGMDGYEAYRTIPARKVEFIETNWQTVRLPLEENEELLEARLRNLLQSNETSVIADSEIFSGEGVKEQFLYLQEQMQLRNIVLNTSIKRIKVGESSLWRGFNVQVEYAGGLTAMTNLVVKTDEMDKICGVWLGMKPLDFRLLSRKYNEEDKTERLANMVEYIEREYTDAVCGRGMEISDFPVYPAEGWHWSELEDINIEVMENGVVYNYRLTLAGLEESWDFELKGIKE
jgi:hypothetical protein